MTFETAIKHAMDEALFPHGFQRVKGRRPYYVRMIGDEIAQIMCYWKQLEFRKSIEERTKNLSEGRLKDECMALAEAQIERFQRYTQESDLQKKIDEELERRKQFNQAMLRECGIKF